MDSFRQGNDLHIVWKVKRNGEAENFDGKDVVVRVIGSFSKPARIEYSVSGNVVDILFKGMHQIMLGCYDILLTLNEGKENMSTLDVPKAFKLVPRSCAACDCTMLDLESDFCMPANGLSAYEIARMNGFAGTEKEWVLSLKGADGKSAYDLWLDEGNSGTLQEFVESLKGKDGDRGKSAYEVWLSVGNKGSIDDYLQSIKGEKGDKGDDGNLLYPKYDVTTEMHLVVDSDVSTERVSLSDKGHFIINI